MKKKALVLAVCMAFAAPTITVAKALPSNFIGVSLGEVEAKSFLNEPFEGIIPILFTNIEASKSLKVKLAPNSLFNKMGVEKLAILNNLKFKIKVQNNKPVISITSTQTVQMPFLSFVLEISGSQGNIYQDYTTLLDPRGYEENSLSTNNKQEIAQDNLFIESFSSSILANDRRTYTVKSGDTLSEIAQALNAAEVSLKKMVSAIHQKNPNAFTKNNINRLKAGAILNIPTQYEITNSNFKDIAKTEIQKNQTKAASNFVTNEIPKDAYTIKKGDTLSHITKNVGHKNVSFTKMMSAIHSANPHAFSKNKINLLKVGKILRIPSLEEISPSTQQATTYKQQQSIKHDSNLIILDYTKKGQSADEQSIQHDPNLIILDNTKQSQSAESTKEFELKGFIIEKGDTLAKITKEIGYDSIPFPKMMKAIYTANPDAFEKNNITMLVEGAIIRLPSKAEIEATNNTQPKETESRNRPESRPVITDDAQSNNNVINNSAPALNNLEKRVRELKRELGNAHSNLSQLETTLVIKETLIKEQSQGLKQLATTLETFKTSNELATTSAITKHDDELQALLIEASTPDNLESTTPEGGKIAPPLTMEDELLGENIRRGYIPLNVSQSITNTLKKQLTEYSQYMSGKELLSSILALLFGLLLIRYRREIYHYTRVSYDHPTYYPPFDKSVARAVLKEKTINYQDTLVDIEEEVSNFSDKQIEECEVLVEELMDDLDLNINTQNNELEWDSLDKACDDYLNKYNNQNTTQLTDTDNNIIEGTEAEPEEMTFELFEALAEGVNNNSDTDLLIQEEDTNIYALNEEQTNLNDSFEAEKLKETLIK